jgi:hypothetical protein
MRKVIQKNNGNSSKIIQIGIGMTVVIRVIVIIIITIVKGSVGSFTY